jgi:DNA-binding response OmpR family regulator
MPDPYSPIGVPVQTAPVQAPVAQGAAVPRGGMLAERGALPLSGLTVLLVEDSRFASDALRLMCQRSGARLRRAETMEQARAHLRTYRPDVVIVDLGLPDGRGDRLIRDLVLSRRHAVVLGISGDADGRKAALTAGAQGFLEKPMAGLVDFQRAILRHLPERLVILVEEGAGARTAGDPLSLQDDLTHAEALLDRDPDAAQQAYLSSFLSGLARIVDDPALAEAACRIGKAPDALPRLHRLVKDRLAQGAVF